MDELINIGHIVKAHGIRGEICIELNADSSDLLCDFIYLQSPANSTPVRYTVKSIRMHHERPLVTLNGVPDRTAAELLRNMDIFIPQSRLPVLNDDEFYLTDLPGLQVFVRTEDTNEPYELGILEFADEIAGQEIWTIRSNSGKEVLFPVAEQFVELVDFDKNIAVICPPPGLLDLYLNEPEKTDKNSEKSSGKSNNKKRYMRRKAKKPLE
ncbi:ribosome maturation factor RimM [Desulfovibrio sp. OttesenSCG-928-F07]|nr:ribosome maturation factor RimM [Desulfovibrio sp. OttesenSCG-928-F07]